MMANLIYTDGSSSVKSGMCGWALTGMFDGRRVRMAGAMPGTNQLAELYAVIVALNGCSHVGGPSRIVSDSMYAIGCMTTYRKKWESNGFMTAAGTPVNHVELIKSGHRLMDQLAGSVEFVHVRGHRGEAGNEEADLISRFIRYMADKSGDPQELLKKIMEKDQTEIMIDWTKFPVV
jgi:ribonuclease HI